MVDVLIVLIVFSSVLAVIKMSFDYKRRALTAHQGDGGSLRTSELKQLIREAVDDALEPIIERLDQQGIGLAGSDQLLLDEASAETLSEESGE